MVLAAGVLLAGYNGAARSIICFTLQRSMFRSRAIARLLRPSACQLRTTCSIDDADGTTDGSACLWFVGDPEPSGVGSAEWSVPGRR
jgi:hypothetical protein